ncbi:MAG: NADH-quinone oxidoreductase subunit C [Bacteroidota bacterium]|jgi:NADH-quinone oxidoreductase subunit C
MALASNEIFEYLNVLFPETGLQFDESVPCVIVPAAVIKDIALQVRDDAQLLFDTLMCLSGVDNADGTLGVVYHLDSMTHRHKLTLKVQVPVDNPHLPSVDRVWRIAEWHEREAFDLVGMIFDGNSDHRRILLPDDWEGHPLRKDYLVPEFYNGMKVPY